MGKFEYLKARNQIKRRGQKFGWLAQELGVSAGTVSRWMTGRTVPDGPSLVAIAKALNMKPEDLIAS